MIESAGMDGDWLGLLLTMAINIGDNISE